MLEISRPPSEEYAPFYQKYIDLLPDQDLISILKEQIRATIGLLERVSPEQAHYRYAPGKWSVKEVVGHVADSERIMAYRALRIARGDQIPLVGFDEGRYVEQAGFDSRTMADLLDEFEQVRRATIALLSGLREEALTRKGTANDFGVSVRALAYIIAGHERHHLKILQERYGIGEKESMV